MQRLDCPKCRQWEIITHDGLRDESWTCSNCKAKANEIPQVVIQFGNDYLTTKTATDPNFIRPFTIARRFTFQQAELIRLAFRQQNKHLELITIQAAQERQARRDADNQRAEWFYAFEAEVHRLAAEDKKPVGMKFTYFIQGTGTTKIVYAADPLRAQGLDPFTAAEQWYPHNKPKRVRKTA